MSRQIIKQPSGKYAMWSSIVDDFIHINCSKEDLINFLIEEETEEIRRRVDEQIEKLEEGEKPYYQFTMSWEEALETIKSNYGKKHLNKVLKEIK